MIFHSQHCGGDRFSYPAILFPPHVYSQDSRSNPTQPVPAKIDRMEIQHCVRCGKGLKAPQGINVTGDPAIAIYVIAKTVGIRPRATSPAQRKVFCVPCGISIALGPAPESGAFNEAVYAMLLHLMEQAPAISQVAVTQKLNPNRLLKAMPGSKPDTSLDAPVLRGAVLGEAV